MSYRSRDENVLSLDVPLEAAVNKAEVEAYQVKSRQGWAGADRAGRGGQSRQGRAGKAGGRWRHV